MSRKITRKVFSSVWVALTRNVVGKNCL